MLDTSSLLGSIRSPLAFKPLPPYVRTTPPSGEGVNLGSESDEAKPPPPVTCHFRDPLLPPHGLASPESPDTIEGAKDPGTYNPQNLRTSASRPWVEYVKRLKVEKRNRQLAVAKGFLNPVRAIEQWDYIRTWNRVQLANISVLRWTLLAKAGCQLNGPSILYNLPGELVDAHVNAPRAQASMVAKVLNNLVYADKEGFTRHPMFGPLTQPWEPELHTVSETDATFRRNIDHLLIDLFIEYYQDKPSFVAKFPRDMVLRLAAIAAYRCPRTLYRGGLLNAFFTAVHRGGPKLFLASPLRDSASLANAPTGHVWALFRLVQVCCNSNSPRQAFRLFQRLVREKMVTPSAISQVKVGQGDPRTVVLFAMTRTCLDYGWNTSALELMILAAAHVPAVFDEQMGSLVNETLYLLLKQAALMSPTPKYNLRMSAAIQRRATQQVPVGPQYLLRRIMAFIAALRQGRQVFEIEDKVIQKFYAVARQLDLHHTAESLFSIGRIHTAPTPQMLVSPLFEASGDPSSGSIFPVEPRYIKSTPRSESSATPNSKYPAPRGPSLLWLFEAMLKKRKNIHLSRCLAQEVVDSNIDIPIYDRGQFIRLLANAGLARAGRELWMRYSQDEAQGVIGHPGAMVRLVSLFCHVGKDLEAEEAKEAMVDEGPETPTPSSVLSSDTEESFDDDDVEVGDADGDDAKVLFDADAAKCFVKEVVDKFRACKEPIENASRYDINILARAYFITDRTEEGFALFQMLKTTRSPDMYDVNVVLSSVAKHNARLASRMIDRMYERGLVPHAVTLGTVIHHTFLKGDTELMISLIKRAQEWGISTFTSRTIASLIRASVSDIPSGSQLASHTVTLGSAEGVRSLRLTFGGKRGIGQIRRNLNAAWHLIGTLDTQVYVGTWSLAKFCLDRALWVGDAELGFRFWDRYLGWKTQWNDGDQVKLRKRLYELVVTAKKEEKLETAQAMDMLRKLSGTEP